MSRLCVIISFVLLLLLTLRPTLAHEPHLAQEEDFQPQITDIMKTAIKAIPAVVVTGYAINSAYIMMKTKDSESTFIIELQNYLDEAILQKEQLIESLTSTADPADWKDIYKTAEEHNMLGLQWQEYLFQYKEQAKSMSLASSLVLESEEFWNNQIDIVQSLMIDEMVILEAEQSMIWFFQIMKPLNVPNDVDVQARWYSSPDMVFAMAVAIRVLLIVPGYVFLVYKYHELWQKWREIQELRRRAQEVLSGAMPSLPIQ
jgi:hypothetical protein